MIAAGRIGTCAGNEINFVLYLYNLLSLLLVLKMLSYMDVAISYKWTGGWMAGNLQVG